MYVCHVGVCCRICHHTECVNLLGNSELDVAATKCTGCNLAYFCSQVPTYLCVCWWVWGCELSCLCVPSCGGVTSRCSQGAAVKGCIAIGIINNIIQ